MNTVYDQLRESLHEEYQWLNQTYPLGKKMECGLHVFHEEASDEKECINGLAFYHFHKTIIETDIFLFLDTQKRFSEHDRKIMEMYKIKADYDLYFWMLYHEYGHVMEMKRIRKKSKLRTVKKQMNRYLKKTAAIREAVAKGHITETCGERLYRLLQEEVSADRFANAQYQKRKEEIQQHIRKITNVEGE